MAKFYVDATNRQLVLPGGKRYGLAWGFVCPVTNEAVALIVRSGGGSKHNLVEQYLKDETRTPTVNDGGVVGAVFTGSSMNVSRTDADGNVKFVIRYFYGLKDDPLAEAVWAKHSDLTKFKNFDNFKKKLLANEIDKFIVSKELVLGEETMISVVEQNL